MEPQHVIHKAACVAAIVHRNQPARVDIFSELRGFGDVEVAFPSIGNSAAVTLYSLIPLAAARVINSPGAGADQIPEIGITAERRPVQLRMRRWHGINPRIWSVLEVLHSQVGVMRSNGMPMEQACSALLFGNTTFARGDAFNICGNVPGSICEGWVCVHRIMSAFVISPGI